MRRHIGRMEHGVFPMPCAVVPAKTVRTKDNLTALIPIGKEEPQRHVILRIIVLVLPRPAHLAGLQVVQQFCFRKIGQILQFPSHARLYQMHRGIVHILHQRLRTVTPQNDPNADDCCQQHNPNPLSVSHLSSSPNHVLVFVCQNRFCSEISRALCSDDAAPVQQMADQRTKEESNCKAETHRSDRIGCGKQPQRYFPHTSNVHKNLTHDPKAGALTRQNTEITLALHD